MPSLHELQVTFGAALQDARRADAAAELFRGPAVRALTRLAVYRGNVYGNCAKALASAFPIVRKIVGEEFFDAMAREYARAHPSTSGDLHQYGGRLPEFLEAFAHTADLPYLPDVARMDWLAHCSYYARDSEPFDTAALAGVPPEHHVSLHPRLAPACAVLESAWPLGRLWTIHQDDYQGAFEIDLHAGPDRILVHRPRWRVQVLSLAPGDFRFLDSAARGATLGEALEAAADVDGEFDPSMALARWIDAAVIASVDPQDC